MANIIRTNGTHQPMREERKSSFATCKPRVSWNILDMLIPLRKRTDFFMIAPNSCCNVTLEPTLLGLLSYYVECMDDFGALSHNIVLSPDTAMQGNLEICVDNMTDKERKCRITYF